MTVARLVPLEELHLRAQIDANNNIVGFVDNKGNTVILAVTDSAGQINKPDGTDTAFRTAAVAANSVAPTISGTPTTGELLTGDKGTWTGDDNVYTYAWLRNGTAIAAATGLTYTLVVADEGKSIIFRVTATNPASPSGVAASSDPVSATAP